MNKKKNVLDEFQEQKLLQIEKQGVWFAFWGLLAAILIQITMSIGEEDLFRNIAGEWIVFMCLAVYIGAACIKNGIWDRKLKPDAKTSVISSLLAGAICALVFFLATYFKYGKLLGSIATAVFMFIVTFVACIAAFYFAIAFFKKRVAKLEADSEDDSNI